VLIDSTARFFGAEHIAIGSDVRIDAYSVISAGEPGVEIGDHVHLGTGVQIFGRAGVVLEDFVGLASGVRVYSENDDYVGGALTGPTVPDDVREVYAAPVHFGKHVIVGAQTVILPGVVVGQAAAVGALSLVSKSVSPDEIVVGNPLRSIGKRDGERLTELERQLRERESGPR